MLLLKSVEYCFLVTAFMTAFLAAFSAAFTKLKRRRGDLPYTALTIAALLLVLIAVAFFGFGNLFAPPAGSSPSPSPLSLIATASPSARPSQAAASPSSVAPVSSLYPSLAPSPSPIEGGWPSPPAGECASDGCLSEKPFYCASGKKISNCPKCGCPSGTVCGKGSPAAACECIPSALSLENCSLTGLGGNVTAVSPSPKPSASPTPPPCNASHYAGVYGLNASNSSNNSVSVLRASDSAFLANLSAAYSLVFNENVSWTHPEAYLWTFKGEGGGALNELFVYKGYYRGWQPSDVVTRVVGATSKCFKEAAVFNPPASSPPWVYEFKVNCWNWAFLVEAKIKDFQPGSFTSNRGSALASRFVDVCPP
jgi:hypothetical protein